MNPGTNAPFVPERIELAVTFFCLRKRQVEETSKTMKECEKLIAKAMRKLKKKVLLIGSREYRLTKDGLSSEPMHADEMRKHFIDGNQCPFHLEMELHPISVRYVLARQKFNAAYPHLIELQAHLIAHMERLGVRVWVCRGWELRRIQKKTLRCRIVGPIDHAKVFDSD